MKRCAIVGGGISGLSAAYFLQKKLPDLHIDLYDSQNRAGGVIRSELVEGCAVEAGPDSFLTMKKSAIRLCADLGLANDLVGSNDHQRKTFLFHEAKLKELPEGFFMMVPTRLIPFAKTGLLSWPGKFDALADLFSFPEERDCTAADFLERRFGKEILDRVAEPMISGIYGADIGRLSLKSALPQIWELQKKGSLIRQFIRPGGKTTSKEPLFTTLANGMESLVKRLQETVRANWKLGTTVEEIQKQGPTFRIGADSYDLVLIASSTLPRLDHPEDQQIHSLWKSIRRNSAIVVVLAFSAVRREGFGWLVPAVERHSILAATYVSNKFSGRSPEELFLVRVFIGGEHALKWIERSDDEIREEVLNELDRIAGIDKDPVFLRIHRWQDAMPEYNLGHGEKMEAIQKLIRMDKGLFITGNVFSGVGVPDCIQHAEKVAAEMCSEV